MLERLMELRAADLMTRQVVTLDVDYTLRDAAMVLRAAKISGAPVVDESGRPIGILSATDIVSFAQKSRPDSSKMSEGIERRDELSRQKNSRLPRAGGDGAWREESGWSALESERFELECIPSASVRDYMSSKVISVIEEAPLLSVARTLCEHHIHRALVVDTDGRLKGVVSTLDFLAALVNAADETAS